VSRCGSDRCHDAVAYYNIINLWTLVVCRIVSNCLPWLYALNVDIRLQRACLITGF
jgi:hypothetical protein